MIKKWGFAGLVLLVTFALGFACEKKADTSKVVQKIVKVGITGAETRPIWEVVQKNLDDGKSDIKIELVEFSDYTIPNQALADEEIDLNGFQHNAFLAAEIAAKKFQLTAIGDTMISFLGVYSDKIKNLQELKKGDTIVIPNDATNGGRALKVLEAAGIIKLDPAKGHLPTVADITSNPLDIKILEVDASQVVRVLPDVAAGIANSNYIIDAGKVPLDEAIFIKPIDKDADKPYINILAARTKDKDDPVYKAIVSAYQQPNVAEVIRTYYKGASLPAW
ncbi:MAG: MetQ/NlpA family ABC transporter substrate-binding protein [Spirochaetaceae bacterium]|jgi:D-methionine transport system substrate-binding protein|nr:MetQ/NlpA family ABC transporter substrate-binding protein [Spirochaetaceae bacterium]